MTDLEMVVDADNANQLHIGDIIEGSTMASETTGVVVEKFRVKRLTETTDGDIFVGADRVDSSEL